MSNQPVLAPAQLPSGANALPEQIVGPRREWLPPLRELLASREVLYFLVWRDIKVRYKQTALGAAWAILQPLATMLVFSLFFGRLAHVPSDGVPYPLFAYCALLPWQVFAFSLSQSGNSLVENRDLLKKVYFPRLIIPIVPVLTALMDFAVAAPMLLVLIAIYGFAPHLSLVFLPIFLLLAVVTAFAAGIWMAALNVMYRDVRYIIPFITQFWMFVTPIAYPSSLVPGRWRILYGLNPMVGVVEGFRWALLGTQPPPAELLLASATMMLLMLGGGLLCFQRMEDTFADIA